MFFFFWFFVILSCKLIFRFIYIFFFFMQFFFWFYLFYLFFCFLFGVLHFFVFVFLMFFVSFIIDCLCCLFLLWEKVCFQRLYSKRRAWNAFDNLAFMVIEKAMKDNNYPPLMIRWFMNFLKNRTAIADVLGVKLCIRPMCGTPQGGVLSSRIWNLAFDPLLKLLNQNSPCAPVGFADNGALCFRGIDPVTLVEIAQPKINQAVAWGAKNGLSFSVDKTTAVFFSRQKKFHSQVLPKLKKLTMNGVEINPSPSMTYLGVILDQKLNWSLHIDNKVAKAKKILHLIKPALHHIWGLNPKRMQWIYKQIILPRLTYGCLVWGHSLTKSQIYKIETVERVAMQCYASTWKKNPTASLQILYNQLPSQLDIMYVTIKTYIRCKHIFQKNHWDGIAEYASANSHLKTIKSLCHEIHHEGTPLDLFHSNFMMDPYYSWNPPVRTSLTAVGMNDTDDYQINLVDNVKFSQEDEPIPTGSYGGVDPSCNRMECCSLHGDHSQHVCIPTGIFGGSDHMCNRMECCSLHGDLNNHHVCIPTTECRHPHDATATAAAEAAAAVVATHTIIPPEVEFSNGALVPLNLIPSSTSKSTQLTLDKFENNYRLFSQRLKNDDGLSVRVITLKVISLLDSRNFETILDLLNWPIRHRPFLQPSKLHQDLRYLMYFL